MATLYRNSRNLQYWFVHLPRLGWLAFPAGAGGWAYRRSVCIEDYGCLQPVPLWLAFNTGLLEDLERRRNRVA
jgi:hypothetical protein